MKIKSVIFALLIFPLLISCKDDYNTPGTGFGGIDDSFNTSPLSWTGDFADYPKDNEAFYELKYSHENLPAPLDQTAKGIRISGNNHSDDLLMFMKKKISGLVPNRSYRMKVDVQLASNARKGDLGVGGSPGSGVILKAGFTATEPVKTLDNTSNHYRLNIDKGNQSVGGADAVVLGDVENGIDKQDYTLIERSGEFTGKADDKGEAWVMIGTDSGFEATTTLYYTKVKASFTAID